ncbi:uncharacterized protein LOC128559427 [Mercenaria mercenaria]|uniref:uncharacterized protein LOC128559427 n=1 Tax=Mercenaria mercenaria TaxID=6596 RepID=UPI00234E4795|nr:uncharacterized protein LOC128559427 [Mercenaria mercenaria]
MDKFLSDKKCILRVQNRNNLCCARAIITAKARIDGHEKWNSIRQGSEIQRRLAEKLHNDAGVLPTQCGIAEIKIFQSFMTEYQIYVVSKEHFNAIIFKGPEAEKKIYLYYHDHHYDVITSMPAFVSRNYYCTQCDKGYDHKEDHKCNSVCYACRKVHDQMKENWIEFETCRRFFRGQECYDQHKRLTAKGNSTCSAIYRRTECGKTVNKKVDQRHICGQIYCNMCKGFFPETHKCYMIPETTDFQEEPMSIKEEMIKEVENPKTFIFFDFECTQDDLLQYEKGYSPDVYVKCQNCLKSSCGCYEHKSNLCVAQKVCTICMDKEFSCENCGKRKYIFGGDNDFCHWLFSEENYNSTVLCHNFQGYDSYSILKYLYANAIVPKVIPNGAKSMCLTVPSCKIKMIDSINFLPMALSKLPAMFGFDELKKGYFPHLFNKKENQQVVLDGLPDLSFYNPDGMKPDDRQTFLKWYSEHKNDTFKLPRTVIDYCKSDSDILRRCCLRFREDFMDTTDIDPFELCLTIAFACNLVFRTNFLKSETIGLIPRQGFNPEQKQSMKALQWVKYISHIEGHKIQHARNGGEKVIGPYRVDGYYESVNGEKIVLEFHGDFWHGNPAKYSRSTVNPVNQFTMGELYDHRKTKIS